MYNKNDEPPLNRRNFGDFGKMAALKKGLLLNSSELRLLTLYLLSQRPSHGYEIIKSVGDLTTGTYSPSPGMVYPALSRIEKLSHAVSKVEGERKLFHITEEGTTFLNAKREQLNEILGRIDFLGRKMASMQKHLAQDQMSDERWGANSKDNAEFQDLRHEFRAALFEKLTASPEEKARIVSILKDAIKKIRSK